jgi:hypothetical protein
MKRYYKHDAESDLGVGTAYLEITDEWPSRQVEIYGDQWRWGDSEHNEHLADQPFDVLELSDEHVIGHEEFEKVWREAKGRWQPSS